jgi:hypothetical protein
MTISRSPSISDHSDAKRAERRRVATICLCLLISLSSLIAAVAAHERGLRLASDSTVIATVKNVLMGRSGTPGEYAHLTYDRRDQDGQFVHCDVPRVHIGNIARRIAPGDLVTIAPRADSCWDPDIICDICAPTKESVQVLSLVSVVSGVLFVVLIWRGKRVSE